MALRTETGNSRRQPQGDTLKPSGHLELGQLSIKSLGVPEHPPDILGVLVALGAIFTRAALCKLLPDVGARTLVVCHAEKKEVSTGKTERLVQFVTHV